jgi:ADP-heptose:LPS heptosyltransferase
MLRRNYLTDTCRYILLFALDSLCRFLPVASETSNKKKVLIIKPDSIGDFVIWLDAAKDLRRLYPAGEYEMILLGNTVWTPLVNMLPYFNDVWTLDRPRFIKSPGYRFDMLRRIRRMNFDTVIYFVSSREFLFGDAIVRVSNAKNRIGSTGDTSNISFWLKSVSDRWYTSLLNVMGAHLMELERNAYFMRGLGLRDFKAGMPRIEWDDSLPAHFSEKNYYVIVPGAGASYRRWSIEKYKELAKLIYKETGWKGIVCGDSGEEFLGRSLENSMNASIQSWIGKTSLSELVAIINGASLVIGNETGAVHIAAALSTPSVCIVGGGHYGRFLPYKIEKYDGKCRPEIAIFKMSCFGCNWFCSCQKSLESAYPCIANVSVESVWKKVVCILKDAMKQR